MTTFSIWNKRNFPFIFVLGKISVCLIFIVWVGLFCLCDLISQTSGDSYHVTVHNCYAAKVFVSHREANVFAISMNTFDRIQWRAIIKRRVDVAPNVCELVLELFISRFSQNSIYIDKYNDIKRDTPKIFPVILMNLRYCLAPIWYSASTCRKYGRKKMSCSL